ncbi:hypothetical protein NLU13_7150 [Sarocladium strictum]|uniref:LysM domain-containing protein n=1 Tax=Sarocladium strictum TaxID=5046 RepID=A0AA39GFC7_SARSR|nr:hypothetical protein NLU13_7150 [Sarocladium strictum]
MASLSSILVLCQLSVVFASLSLALTPISTVRTLVAKTIVSFSSEHTSTFADDSIHIMDETPNMPFDPNTEKTCVWWWDNDGSIACKDMPTEWGISMENWLRWNPSLTSDCGNFINGRSYCVEAPSSGDDDPQESSTTSSSQSSSTTTSGNGIATPTPTQSGIVSNCNKFHLVKDTTTCQGIVDYNKISMTDFMAWNNGVNAECTNLWLGTYACVGVLGGTQTTKTTTSKPSSTTKGNGIATPTPTQPGMAGNCNKFHLIKETTTCQGIVDYNKISMADFNKWNPTVNTGCTNLWLGTYACVGVLGATSTVSTTKTTTTSKGNGVTTPTPTQPGMVSNCNKFHLIKEGTTCQGIVDYNKITMANFKKWNPAVNDGCTNLWLGSYACVGVIGGITTSTTTKKPTSMQATKTTGIVTPTPTQTGMVKGCTQFHKVSTTTTCQAILDRYSLTLAKFVKWNPAVKSDCSNLWANTYACVKGP